MHAPGSFATAAVATICFLLCASIVATYPTTDTTYRTINVPKKCCAVGYAFNEDLECVHTEPHKLDYTTHDVWQPVAQHPQQIATMVAFVRGLSCREDIGASNRHFLGAYANKFYVPREYCIERMINGTTVLVKCPGKDDPDPAGMTVMMRTTTTTTTTVTAVMTITTTVTRTTTRIMANASSNASREENGKGIARCGDGLRTVIFWGAQTYMDTNVAHAILCAIVVVVYLSIPELGKGIYNRAILRHNVCLLALGCILTLLGYCELCECPMSINFSTFLWILLQYFTHATGFWLNVICVDMTLSITKVRWMAGSGQRTNREENKRLLLYGTFAWGGALIPAVIALILEYSPGIPEDFPLKPNYSRYRDGPNVMVNIYFFSIPLLTLFWNNVLFAFTTYKIIQIQRSTEIATKNQTNVLKKKYILFVQMYLLMGAPWFFGLLLAFLNKLMILKICRLLQPILWLLTLAIHKKFREKLKSKLPCVKKREANVTNS